MAALIFCLVPCLLCKHFRRLDRVFLKIQNVFCAVRTLVFKFMSHELSATSQGPCIEFEKKGNTLFGWVE